MTEVIDRIKKLLNMTAANGCTEDEAETAMRMAAGLMAKHGIDQSQLSAAEQKSLAKIGKRISREFKRYQLVTAWAAGELYGCKAIHYGPNGKFGMEFVGRPENIEAAEETMFWLFDQLERFYKEALPRGMSVSERARYRKTFKEACALRIRQRVTSLVFNMMKNNASAQSATGHNALVVSGYFEKLAEENSKLLEGVRVSKPMKFTAGSGTYDGQRAGDRVQLRKELS